MTRNESFIAKLDALSRTRALTDAESYSLERSLRAAGLIPLKDRSGKSCVYGHEIAGDNAIMHNGRPSCRVCRDQSRVRSQATARAKRIAIRGEYA